MSSYSDSYKDAGVDITAGYKAVELMKEHIAKTMIFGKTVNQGVQPIQLVKQQYLQDMKIKKMK